jgi:hypothetical protein
MFPKNVVCFKYIIVNTLHECDDDNNNYNYCPPLQIEVKKCNEAGTTTPPLPPPPT